MFNNLQSTIKQLNANTKDVANSQQAIKLRKKLLAIGISLTVLGVLAIITCIALFMFFGTELLNSHANSDITQSGDLINKKVFIPLFLIFPSAIILMFGVVILSLALKIVIVGYTAKLVDETVGENCPNCGKVLSNNAQFCANCGTKTKIACPKCGRIVDPKSRFCEGCGESLN